jgi:ESF2/ABP1 family protein
MGRGHRWSQVYISRVPPFMKPEKLRHLLGKFGELNRIYLVPEDKAFHKKRVAAGGNRRQSYTEGWVEFEDKKVARRVAGMLNTTQIGGRKRDYYHDDIWNLKYLKGFKWDHLTEKIAYENRIRDQKLRMEIAQAKKENDAYLERVEQSKQFAKMDERKAGSRKADKAGAGADAADQLAVVRRAFVQKTPTSSKQTRSLDESGGGDLLNKVFKKRKVDV